MRRGHTKTVFIIQLGLVALYFLFGRTAFLWAAVGLGLVSILVPRAAYAIDWGWTRLSEALGWISSRGLLGIIFILVLIPVATLSRLFRKEHLVRRKPSKTNWKERTHRFIPGDLTDPF